VAVNGPAMEDFLYIVKYTLETEKYNTRTLP